jgi:AmiR/NasT family two-component response regulator
MADDTLILLQKHESSLTSLLEEALVQSEDKRLVVKSEPPLLRVAYSPQGLVVWSVAGFAKDEIAEFMREMSSDQVGVLIAGDYNSPVMQDAFFRVNPLGIITPGQTTQSLGVTLELAWAHHRRAHELSGQVENLRDELADRLVVEKAKRLLMESLGYSEDQAMRRLQRYSRNSNMKMAKVAQQLIAGRMVFKGDDDSD